MVEIVKAAKTDKEKILAFIREHWREDHIFVRDSAFFDYEMGALGSPQFIIAYDEERIVGLIGYVQYHPDTKQADLFLVLLRVLEDYARLGLGLKLLVACKDLTGRNAHTVGANPKAIPFYQITGFKCGYLKHFFWPNPKIDNFTIASLAEPVQTVVPDPDGSIIELQAPIDQESFDQIEQGNNVEKSCWYFNKRYFDNPIHKYRLFAARDLGVSGQITGLGATRTIEHGGSQILRIVDWLGPAMSFARFINHVKAEAVAIEAEYVQMHMHGMTEQILDATGLKEVSEPDMVPTYFSPFAAKNIKLTFATTCKEPVRLFQGDGDQDRPS